MPLPFWMIEQVQTEVSNVPFSSMIKATCPRCGKFMLVARSWPRVNRYGTAGCPWCFGTARIPGTKRHSIFEFKKGT